MEGYGHGPLDFHASIKLQVSVTKVFEDWFYKEEEVLTCRRRLVRGPNFEKMGV